MPANPIDAKRQRLYDLISAKRKARAAAAAAFPELDMNELASTFNRADGDTLRRDISRMSEQSLDELIEFHSPTSIRYAW